MKTTPVCQSLTKWLKINRGPKCYVAMCGADSKALDTAMHLISLYCHDGHPSILKAFAIVVNRMQPTARPLAYHAIAHVMDWPDRGRVWALAGLPEVVTGPCHCEPVVRTPGATSSETSITASDE